MITHPKTEELAESVRLWIDEIRPTLDPRNAFLARVAANAMATIYRELTQGPAAEAAAVAGMAQVLGRDGDFDALNTELCERIRAGELTRETPGLLAALTTMARDQIAIDQPSYRPEGDAAARRLMGRFVLPFAAVVCAMAAFQVSASFAKALFPVMGASGAASLRLLLGALMLLALTRPWRNLPDKPPWGAILGLGVSVAAAVALFYAAMSRLPQGVAIALQFLGPLAVALFGSRRARDLVWAALAVAGVWALVGQGAFRGGHIDLLGVVFALGAAVGWAGYILFGRRTGAIPGRVGAAFATAIAAIIVLPVGLATAGSAMFTLDLLPLAALVALFSTAAPFSLELFAMARMPGKTFAILTSLEPAFGCLSGLVLLHEQLSAPQLLGVAAVIAAAAGATWSAGQEGSPLTE